MWSEKARHALEAMEGDSEKTKISYFSHWIDSEGMAKIESWKNSKTLISQEDYEKLEENERIRDRIILEYKDLLILVISLENPQGWRISA